MELSFVRRRLARFPSMLEAQLAAIPDAALDFAPADWTDIPSERLTIRQQVCHLRDIEAEGYGARFARTLSEQCPILPSIDTYQLATDRNYDLAPIGIAFSDFVAARQRNVALLSTLAPDDIARTADFEGYGRTTFLGLAHYLASHDSQHLAGVDWLLGKFVSAQ